MTVLIKLAPKYKNTISKKCDAFNTLMTEDLH